MANYNVATILAMAAAAPAQALQQSSYPDFYFRVTGSQHMTTLNHKFHKLCEGSGIQTRHMVLTEDFLKENPSMCQYGGKSFDARQGLVCEEIPKLAKEVADKAVRMWGRPISDITHLVFFTSTSVDMPGADVALANLMGLSPTVKRMMFYMQGCSSAGTLLRVTKDVAENNEGSRVLLVCGDIGSVATFRGPSEDDTANLVGQTFFGDGMSALVVGASCGLDLETETPLFQIHASLSYLIPYTQGSAAGHVTESGMTFSLARDFADLVSTTTLNLLSTSSQLKHHLKVETITPQVLNSCFWVAHAGGKKFLDLLEEKLRLKPDKLKQTREILAENGNMGACTAIFALERLLLDSISEISHGNVLAENQWGFLVGYGPGIAIEIALLKACKRLTKSPSS